VSKLPFVVDWRWAFVESELPSTALHVLLTLALHMNGDGAGCYPSIELLVRQTKLADSTVRKQLAAAVEKGWIRREGGRGRGNSYRYQATIPDGSEQENRRPAAVKGPENRRGVAVKGQENRRERPLKPPGEAPKTAGRGP
jgi:Helix-turn-helix domain